jgi:hypothetical protein
MAESTLTLQWSDLMNFIAARLGWGREADPSSPAVWSAEQVAELQEVIDEAERRRLHPPAVGPYPAGHPWSFLHPTAEFGVWAEVDSTITGVSGTGPTDITDSTGPFYQSMIGKSLVTADGTYTITGYTSTTVITVAENASAENGKDYTITPNGNYQLPDDFGDLADDILFEADGRSYRFGTVPYTEILQDRMDAEITATPAKAAIRSKSSDGTAGQRQELMLWPTPNADLTLLLPYNVLVNALSSSAPYPLGGMRQSSLIQASCLAVLDDWHFDNRHGWQTGFERELIAAISKDYDTLPDTLGYMHDPAVAGMTAQERQDYFHQYTRMDLSEA